MTTEFKRSEPQTHSLVVAPMDATDAAAALAHVLGTGDLYQLTNEQRVAHYINQCRSIGVSPLGRPYQWIEFKESENAPAVLTLYFKPAAAAGVLRNAGVSVSYPRKEIVGELFVCEAHGRAPDGREGVGTKYVSLVGKFGRLSGQRLGNAYMSAETGALRRLAINMGFAAGLDDDRTGTTRPVYVDGTGAVLDAPTEEQKHLADHPNEARVLGEPTYETTAATYPETVGTIPSQAVTPEELEPVRRSVPRQSFRPSAEQVAHWRDTWFATVKGTSLATDDARHAYVAAWTMGEGWPEAKQTNSLPIALARMTEREADDFLAHVRALADDERAAAREALAALNAEQAVEEVDEETF